MLMKHVVRPTICIGDGIIFTKRFVAERQEVGDQGRFQACFGKIRDLIPSWHVITVNETCMWESLLKTRPYIIQIMHQQSGSCASQHLRSTFEFRVIEGLHREEH